jgi:hypothetical protein
LVLFKGKSNYNEITTNYIWERNFGTKGGHFSQENLPFLFMRGTINIKKTPLYFQELIPHNMLQDELTLIPLTNIESVSFESRN